MQPRHLLFAVPLVALATAGSASAQVSYGGVGVGIGVGPRWGLASPPGFYGPGPAWGAWRGYPSPGTNWGYYGLGGGPFVGYPWGFGWAPPGAFGSFWTNGLSLYGPPVPVYGPTPGVFGGGDEIKTFFRKPPPTAGVYFGLGWGGYRTPSPRAHPPNVSVFPGGKLLPDSILGPEVEVGTPPANPDCFRITVRVPDESAELWVEKKATQARGKERIFDSPPLKAGETYRYELIANWKEDGQQRAESRVVTAKPGQSVVVDFSKPDNSVAVSLPAATPSVPLDPSIPLDAPRPLEVSPGR